MRERSERARLDDLLRKNAELMGQIGPGGSRG